MQSIPRELVSVHWTDTTSYHRWIDIDDVLRDVAPKDVISFGILLAETPNFIVIAPMWAEDDDVNSATCIPMGMIKEVVRRGFVGFSKAPGAMEAEQAEQK